MNVNVGAATDQSDRPKTEAAKEAATIMDSVYQPRPVSPYCPDPWHTSTSRRRMIALRMFEDGHAPTDIAAALRLCESLVRNTLAAAGRKPWEMGR